MKRRVVFVLTFVAAIAAIPFTAAGQSTASRTSAFSVDLVAPSTALVQALQAPGTTILQRIPVVLVFQHSLAEHFSLAVIPDLNYSLGSSAAGISSIFFGQLVAELDWHPWDTGLAGFYVGGQLVGQLSSWLQWSNGGDGEEDRYGDLGLGVAVGYEVVLPSGLALNAAFGVGALYGAGEGTSSLLLQNPIPRSGLGFTTTRLELTVGYAF